MREIIIKNESQRSEMDRASTHKILVYGTDFALKRLRRLIENKVSLFPYLKDYPYNANSITYL